MKKYALIVPFAFSTSLALAEQPYIGVDYFGASYSQANGEMDSQGLRIKAGSEINQYLAAEVHVAMTAEDTFELDGGDEADVTMEYLYGMALRGQIPMVDNKARFYGTLGYSYASYEVEGEVNGEAVNGTDSDDGVSVGIGFDVTAYENWLVNIDYTSYINSNSSELNGASIGVKYELR